MYDTRWSDLGFAYRIFLENILRKMIFLYVVLLAVKLTLAQDGQEDTQAYGVLHLNQQVPELGLLTLSEEEEENIQTDTGYTDSLRAQFPDCPIGCENGWPGDLWCDSECAGDDCGNDAGDCEGWCSPDCNPEWLADGFCDRDCNLPECDFDKGDCESKNNVPGTDKENFDYSKCSCSADLLDNEKCDDECNTKECNWDKLYCNHQCTADCAFMWLGDGDCDDACNIPECDYDKGDCSECAPGCVQWQVGNGLCDTACYNKKCDHDMGDCDGICKTYPFSYDDPVFHYPHCRDEWIGDGHCDCLCNVEECDFDGGECKGHNCTSILRDFRATVVAAVETESTTVTKKPPGPSSEESESEVAGIIEESRLTQKPSPESDGARRELGSNKQQVMGVSDSVTDQIRSMPDATRRRLLKSLMPSEDAAASVSIYRAAGRNAKRRMKAAKRRRRLLTGAKPIAKPCMIADPFKHSEL